MTIVEIILICVGAVMLFAETMARVNVRRLAKEAGILAVKYPAVNGRLIFPAVMLAWMTAALILLCRDPDRYRFWIIVCAVFILRELLELFGHGAYITRSGVLYFGGLGPLKTSARLENGAVVFYTHIKKERREFALSDSLENRELFNGFIQQNVMEE